MNSYRRLTQVDRILIKDFLILSLSQTQITDKLKVHKSTISREISEIPHTHFKINLLKKGILNNFYERAIKRSFARAWCALNYLPYLHGLRDTRA